MKVLFHINDDERWDRLLKNVENFVADVGDSSEIIVLANGSAVSVYESHLDDICVILHWRMEALLKSGVKFRACRNALNALDIADGDPPAFVEIVPAGITEIVKRQMDGFAYIKP